VLKIVRDSIGFIITAILIVALLGAAGWSVYAGRKVVGELAAPDHNEALEASRLKPNEPTLTTSPTSDPSGNQALQRLEERLRRLEKAQSMPQSVARRASSSIALLVGEYIWTDRTGRKPLRYAGLDNSGNPLRDSEGQEIVSFDGEGPIVIREFTGTAFLLTSGDVLTSDFILKPWNADPLFNEAPPERVPSLRLLHAYFPGSTSTADLKIEHVDESSRTVLCSIKGGRPSAAGLQLDNRSVNTGEALVSIGYPGGVGLIVARAPEDVRRELFKFPTTATDEIAEFLAQRGLIQPVVEETRVTALTEGNIYYDMMNTFGSTGAPLLNGENKVVAFNEAVNSSFPGLNLALPLKSEARHN